jgi:hypothetical protein
VLADPHLGWPPGLGPDPDDRRRLAWLARPMQQVHPALPDGTLTLPRPPRQTAVDGLILIRLGWRRCISRRSVQVRIDAGGTADE